MGQLGSANPSRVDDSGTLSLILLSASMLSLVISFMGIKLKWFRHRLTLEQPEIATDTPALLRTTSATEFRENCARGVYRQSVDSESLILSEKPSNPATNGKAKTKASYRQSIFHFPIFRSKLSLARGTSHEDRPISTIQHAASSVQPANREQDAAIHQKNENLKRMIHEKLHGTSSNSMPELPNRKSGPRKHRERSVDDVPSPSPRVQIQNNVPPPVQNSVPPIQKEVEAPDEEMTVFEFVKGLSVPVGEKEASSSASELPAPDENFQKKVQFEKVNEIPQTFYEVHVDEAFGESSTDSPFGYEEASSPTSVQEIDMPPPTPMKRKSRENSLQKVDDELVQNSEPVFERISTEYKFEKVGIPDDSDNDPIVVEIPIEEIPEAEVHEMKPNDYSEVQTANDFNDHVLELHLPAFEPPIAAELNAVLEAMPPIVKPRTRKVVERTSDVGKIEENGEVHEAPQRLSLEIPEAASGVSFLQGNSQIQEDTPQTAIERVEPQAELPKEEFFVSKKFSEDYENISHQRSRKSDIDSDSSSEVCVTPPIENIHIVPKSILKTSENSGVQKTLTFHNVPDSASSSSESFFSDEEPDVWSQVDQHRFQLSRNQMPDVPPPLPKTPPPTAEEESRFSYA